MSAASPRLSILIISYNTREMTLACLASVRREAIDQSYEIIVVDNASTDGSAEAIVAQFPDIHLIASKENLGFARANNVAAKRARGEYLLLLNPDTEVLDHAIDKLVAFAEQNPRARIWGGRTVFADGSLNPTSCWRRMRVWSLFCVAVGLAAIFPKSQLLNWEGYGAWQRDTVRPVDVVTGCFFLIPSTFWRNLRGFDPDFFMYAEEVDLCIRAAKAGADPLFTPDAQIIHHCGASESTYASKVTKIFRGKITLAEKHWSAESPSRCAFSTAAACFRACGGVLGGWSGAGAARPQNQS